MSGPTVSFVGELNAAVTAGYSVTVSGINFADTSITATATIGLSSCLTAAWASASSVVCLVAGGEGVRHEARVTVEAIVGTRTATFSYDGTCCVACSFARTRGQPCSYCEVRLMVSDNR